MANPGTQRRPVIVGITGASGHLLARGCVEGLLDYGYPVLLVCTPPGARVWREELEADLAGFVDAWRSRGQVTQYNVNDIGASIASGGRATAGMIVVPCSMGTLSGIATGAAGNLLERAADVTMKEYRPLVLVPREMPLSAIHLRNMLSLARLGVRIVPPIPLFYLKPTTMAEAVAQMVPRILSALGIQEAQDEPSPYHPASESEP
jgi:flavin prenyltransferase